VELPRGDEVGQLQGPEVAGDLVVVAHRVLVPHGPVVDLRLRPVPVRLDDADQHPLADAVQLGVRDVVARHQPAEPCEDVAREGLVTAYVAGLGDEPDDALEIGLPKPHHSPRRYDERHMDSTAAGPDPWPKTKEGLT
jgi:hypothetical protein